MKRAAFFFCLLLAGLSCKTSGKLADPSQSASEGSGISSIDLDPQKIDDLTVLGKVWGFLKYYHPAVADGKYDWDRELFKILPAVLECKTTEKRNKILSAWIDQLGKVKAGSPEKIDSATVKTYPDLAWIDDASLGAELSAKLHEVRRARRTGENVYASPGVRAANPQFHEEAYAKPAYPDAGLRLLAVYRYWNIIQYHFPYKYLIGEDWNAVLPEFILKSVKAGSALEYQLMMRLMIVRIHDSHAGFDSGDTLMAHYYGRRIVPLQVKFIEGQATVTGYFSSEAGRRSGLKSGDVIRAINGKPVSSIVAQRKAFTWASNNAAELRNIAYDLLRTNDSILQLRCLRGDSAFEIRVKSYRPQQLRSSVPPEPDSAYKLLSPEIGYIHIGTAKRKTISEVMSSFRNTKGLIIDVRCYPSESVLYLLSAHLLPEPKTFVAITYCDYKQPGLFCFSKTIKAGGKNPDYYKGKVIILVNERTQSAAEFLSMALRTAPRATVIGSTTSGADGNVSKFTLPGGISTGISGIGIYYPNGGETQRVGIVPDIEVKPTIKGIREGRDEVLEKAIALIKVDE